MPLYFVRLAYTRVTAGGVRGVFCGRRCTAHSARVEKNAAPSWRLLSVAFPGASLR